MKTTHLFSYERHYPSIQNIETKSTYPETEDKKKTIKNIIDYIIPILIVNQFSLGELRYFMDILNDEIMDRITIK